MKNTHSILFFAIVFVLFSCSKSSESASSEMSTEESYAAESKEMANENPKDDNAEQKPTTIDRKLIKEGKVEFETKDIAATRENIFSAIKKYNAYASTDQEDKVPGRISNTIVVRIPAKDFDNFLSDATKGVERFENKSVDVQDVTEEFLDVEARLKTKKELELRYLDLLKQAKKVSEILEIENQIG